MINSFLLNVSSIRERHFVFTVGICLRITQECDQRRLTRRNGNAMINTEYSGVNLITSGKVKSIELIL